MSTLPDFSQPKIAEAIEKLPPEQLDQLPFGCIHLDKSGRVSLYSRREAELSGYGLRPIVGKDFFGEVAPCMDNGYFEGRIEKARVSGKMDIAFSFIGDFSDRGREIDVRVQSASDGGTWIFHRRK